MTAIALLVFVAHNLLIIRQTLEYLSDFVVFQFNTSLESKKAQFLKVLKARRSRFPCTEHPYAQKRPLCFLGL